MKRIVLVLVALSFLIVGCGSSEVEVAKEVTDCGSVVLENPFEPGEDFKSALLCFQGKLATCEPAKFSVTIMGEPGSYEITGLEGDLCHIESSSPDGKLVCDLPIGAVFDDIGERTEGCVLE